MKNTDLYQRMNNTHVLRTYAHMIKNSDIDTVIKLRENLLEQANDHVAYKRLDEMFVERLGK